MELNTLVYSNLVNIENKSTSLIDFFESASRELVEENFVEESFFEAILSREQIYPTGLVLENINIAIPHTDVDHIKKPFIYINKMEDDIEFTQMGSDDKKVIPEYVIILGIKEPKKQVTLLSTLIELFNNSNFLDELQNCNNNDDLIKLFKNN
ncbi:PTS sugar transporter subunit IIA [Dolosigranulum pigrum]|uniref:PTS EIIA type-2 domain-containing protein n=1 Tax=Dolosigranulum pigrum ATCC 51524 TaxID=883103 RepID=H3NDR6_9LACT|nr:PTS sugar transporter subunit IIA [Dolosigranulum pigrum]EHR33643.1 hypothetical protein HMPREF9703_00697 [Dolosigranulum pigrum ATCC 51524]